MNAYTLHTHLCVQQIKGSSNTHTVSEQFVFPVRIAHDMAGFWFDYKLAGTMTELAN